MAQSINTNLMSLNAQRNLSSTQNSLATSMQRLSSGLRVNGAKDDAAGLAIAERMNAQVKGMNVAIRNANDGISMAQTAEGTLGKVGDMLQRMRELAVQSANGTNGSDDRDNLNAEFSQLQSEIGRVVGGAKFNGTALFTSNTATFQVGAGTTTNDTITVSAQQLTGGTAGTSGGLTSSSNAQDVFATITANGSTNIKSNASTSGSAADNATNAIKDIDVMLDKVNSMRANYGAVQNRFDNVVSSLQVSVENQSAARGRIMDADFAQETANLSRSQVLQQAGTAMLTQANSSPNNVLSLLRG